MTPLLLPFIAYSASALTALLLLQFLALLSLLLLLLLTSMILSLLALTAAPGISRTAASSTNSLQCCSYSTGKPFDSALSSLKLPSATPTKIAPFG